MFHVEHFHVFIAPERLSQQRSTWNTSMNSLRRAALSPTFHVHNLASLRQECSTWNTSTNSLCRAALSPTFHPDNLASLRQECSTWNTCELAREMFHVEHFCGKVLPIRLQLDNP